MNVNLNQKLPRAFYARETITVAQELIGKIIVRHIDGNTIAGRIIETEAYRGRDDAASHAYRGKTTRNRPLFGTPGHSYVYFIYGMHWLFNIAAHAEGTPGGILIRAVEPVKGIHIMQHFRGKESLKNLTNGPARLAQAFNINRDDNEIDLVTNNELYLVEGSLKTGETITAGPRIRVPGDDLALTRPWRFRIDNHPYISS